MNLIILREKQINSMDNIYNSIVRIIQIDLFKKLIIKLQMNNEKKLVNFFRSFFQKTCLEIIRNYDKVLKEWLYFNTMISQQIIDYSKIQKYIDSLIKGPIKIFTHQKQIKTHSIDSNLLQTNSPGFFKKKQQIVQKFRNQNQASMQNKQFNVQKYKEMNYTGYNFNSEPLINLNNQLQEKVKKQQKNQLSISRILANLNILHHNFVEDHKQLEQNKVININEFQLDGIKYT